MLPHIMQKVSDESFWLPQSLQVTLLVLGVAVVGVGVCGGVMDLLAVFGVGFCAVFVISGEWEGGASLYSVCLELFSN